MIANGLRGWPPAAARPSSSAAPATRTSTPDVLHGDHDEHRRASCYGKRARLVRRGAAGKGPGQLAPRRRPTLPQALFGKRPTEKDPAKGTSLALHFTRSGGAGNGTSHVTAPAPDLTRSSVAVCLLWVCAGEPGRDVARGDLLERCPVRNAFADVVRPALDDVGLPAPGRELSPVRSDACRLKAQVRAGGRVLEPHRDNGISRATAYRYLDEVIAVLAEQAPELRDALERGLGSRQVLQQAARHHDAGQRAAGRLKCSCGITQTQDINTTTERVPLQN